MSSVAEVSTSVPPTAASCRRCRRGEEVFWYMGLYEYDVDRARQIVADGREPVEVDEESVRASVHESEVDAEHVAHVDAELPGIIAHVRYQTEQGELLHGHVLIDGHHRAARCLNEQRPFFAFLLDEPESQLVLRRGPEDALPPVNWQAVADSGLLAHAEAATRDSKDEREHFLLRQLDGQKTAAAVCAAFHAHFGEPLAREHFNRFLLRTQARGFFAPRPALSPTS